MGHSPHQRDHGSQFPSLLPPLPSPSPLSPSSLSPSPSPPTLHLGSVDREKTCPFLLRTFVKLGSHHSLVEFMNGKVPAKEEEFHVYTWKDVTLRELTDILKTVVPAASRRDARLSFALVFPDINGIFKFCKIGMTLSHEEGKLDDHRVLGNLSFDVGDYVDVAVL